MINKNSLYKNEYKRRNLSVRNEILNQKCMKH